MTLSRLLPCLAAAALAYSALAFLGSPTGQPHHAPQAAPPEARWFIPGPLGYEHGSRPAPPSDRAWLTRSFSGLGRRPGDATWSRFNHLGPTLEFMHNLSNIVRAEDFAAHPEWFPVVAGKRLEPEPRGIYWQPDLGSEAVARRAAELALEKFQKAFAAPPSAATRAEPALPPSFALGINDALIFGESPELLKRAAPPRYFRTRPDYSTLIYSFSNRVAELVQQALNPPGSPANTKEWFIGCLAYYWCEQVPDFPVHPRLVPYLCADRSQGYDAAFKREEQALQQAWAAKGPLRLGIYDYLDGYGFLIPRLHTRLLAEHLAHARAVGFTDYHGESSHNWGLEGPQPWLVAQLLAHPEADAGLLLDEFYTRYFAEAAAPMRAFYEGCEAVWMAQKGPVDWLKYYRNEGQAELFPSSACARLRAFLSEAQHLARSEKVRARVALASDAFGATERFALRWETGKALSRLVARSTPGTSLDDVTTRTLAQALAAYESAERDFSQHLAWLKHAQPYALYPDIPSDFFRTSPASGAKALLQSNRAPSAPDALPCLREDFEAPVLPGRRIAGLQFGADVPAGWLSKLEPAEGMVATVLPAAARSGRAGLRLANQRYSSLYTWRPIPAGSKQALAEAWMRGKSSSAGRVVVLINFLDAKQRLLPAQAGARYLPAAWDREDPDWSRVLASADIPPDAAWAGLTLQALCQLPGDSIDLDDASLTLR